MMRMIIYNPSANYIIFFLLQVLILFNLLSNCSALGLYFYILSAIAQIVQINSDDHLGGVNDYTCKNQQQQPFWAPLTSNLLDRHRIHFIHYIPPFSPIPP